MNLPLHDFICLALRQEGGHTGKCLSYYWRHGRVPVIDENHLCNNQKGLNTDVAAELKVLELEGKIERYGAYYFLKGKR